MHIEANFKILNSTEVKRLKKIKFIAYKRIKDKNYRSNIYKSLNGNNIVLFSYESNDDFFNLYVSTLFLDYIRFSFKDSILLKENMYDDLTSLDFNKEILFIFNNQNKDYKLADYNYMIDNYKIDFDTDYKTRAKALNEYRNQKSSICPFYFWFAIMHDIFPAVKYKGVYKDYLNKVKIVV